MAGHALGRTVGQVEGALGGLARVSLKAKCPRLSAWFLFPLREVPVFLLPRRTGLRCPAVPNGDSRETGLAHPPRLTAKSSLLLMGKWRPPEQATQSLGVLRPPTPGEPWPLHSLPSIEQGSHGRSGAGAGPAWGTGRMARKAAGQTDGQEGAATQPRGALTVAGGGQPQVLHAVLDQLRELLALRAPVEAEPLLVDPLGGRGCLSRVLGAPAAAQLPGPRQALAPQQWVLGRVATARVAAVAAAAARPGPCTPGPPGLPRVLTVLHVH